MKIGQAAQRKGQNERTFREINVIKDGYLCLLRGVPPCAGSVLNNGSQIEPCFYGKRRFLSRGQLSRETEVTFHSWPIWAVDVLFSVNSLEKKCLCVEQFFTEDKFYP